MDRDAPLIDATDALYRQSAMAFMSPPDAAKLTALRERGGKLIVYHGTSDPVFSSDDTAAWYERLQASHGGDASAFARYFPVPGMNHCAGGPATDQFDMLSALVGWVEQGQAPESIVASARGPGTASVNPEVPASWSARRTPAAVPLSPGRGLHRRRCRIRGQLRLPRHDLNPLMMNYLPRPDDVRFLLNTVLGAPARLGALAPFAEVDEALQAQVLDEAGKFVAEVIAPPNRDGDEIGCRFVDGEVLTPPGFRARLPAFVDGGWPALSAAPEDGGQGLPAVLEAVLYEWLSAANHGLTMAPGLLHGAYECLRHHGSDELKQRYLSKIATGEWLATMCLTEAHAGSDLGQVRTRAAAQADGSFRVAGGKIFISGGEHDLTDNIVHLVLCRLPDAPAGPKGLSLVLVPKRAARRRAQCGALRAHRGEDGPARQLDLRDALRRRDRLADRRAEPRAGGDVRDDERGPAACRAAGPRPARRRLAEGRRLCPRTAPDARARPGTGQPRQRGRRPGGRASGDPPHPRHPARLDRRCPR